MSYTNKTPKELDMELNSAFQDIQHGLDKAIEVAFLAKEFNYKMYAEQLDLKQDTANPNPKIFNQHDHAAQYEIEQIKTKMLQMQETIYANAKYFENCIEVITKHLSTLEEKNRSFIKFWQKKNNIKYRVQEIKEKKPLIPEKPLFSIDD